MLQKGLDQDPYIKYTDPQHCPKLLISDPDPTRWVITDPDPIRGVISEPDRDHTSQVVSDPDLDP